MVNWGKYTIYLPFRFRKIKQQNAEYFQRSGEKRVTEHTNTVLDPDYLDAMVLTSRTQIEFVHLIFKVAKMLRGKHGKRLGFLSQRTHPNLPEEEVGLRKDIAREWNHIYETVHFTFSIVGHWNGLHYR